MRAQLASLVLLLLSACAGPAPGPLTGFVGLAQARVGGSSAHALSGFFMYGLTIEDINRGAFPGCPATAEAGSCSRFECDPSAVFDPAGAGELRAAVNGTELLRAPADGSGFYSGQGLGDAFAPGDTITISAAGGTVPAFSGEVTGPEPLIVSLPTTLSRSAGMTLDWSPTIAADIVGLTLMSASGTRLVLIHCRAPASEGTVTLPPALLDGLAPGERFSVNAAATNFTEIAAGDYPVQLVATDGVGGSLTIE